MPAARKKTPVKKKTASTPKTTPKTSSTSLEGNPTYQKLIKRGMSPKQAESFVKPLGKRSKKKK